MYALAVIIRIVVCVLCGGFLSSTLRRFGHGLFAERQGWGSTGYPKLLKMSMHHAQKRKKNKTKLKSRMQRTSTKHKLQAITQSHTIESNPRVKRNTTKCKCKMQNETPIQKMHTKDAKKNNKKQPLPGTHSFFPQPTDLAEALTSVPRRWSLGRGHLRIPGPCPLLWIGSPNLWDTWANAATQGVGQLAKQWGSGCNLADLA